MGGQVGPLTAHPHPARGDAVGPREVTDGQLEHELQHLRAKLAARSPDRLPLAVRASAQGTAQAARPVGRVYVANTLGALVAGVAAGLVGDAVVVSAQAHEAASLRSKIDRWS